MCTSRAMAQRAHELSGGLTTAQVAELGDEGDGDRALDATHRLERLHDGGETPPLDLLPEFGLEALQPFLMVRNGADVLLEDHRLRRRGTDHCRQPAQRSGPPGGTALIPDILLQQEGRQPVRGGLEIPDGILPGAAEVADRRVLDCRDIDSREIARAHESGQLGRITSIGVDAGARLLRDQRWGHDPTDQFFLGEIAIKPVPAGSSFVDKDQRFRFRGERADELVNVALASTETPQEDDLCLPRLADIGNGDGVFVNIDTDAACGSVRPGGPPGHGSCWKS